MRRFPGLLLTTGSLPAAAARVIRRNGAWQFAPDREVDLR